STTLTINLIYEFKIQDTDQSFPRISVVICGRGIDVWFICRVYTPGMAAAAIEPDFNFSPRAFDDQRLFGHVNQPRAYGCSREKMGLRSPDFYGSRNHFTAVWSRLSLRNIFRRRLCLFLAHD